MEQIFDAIGNYLGFKSTRPDGTVDVHGKDGSYKGWAGENGMFESDGTIRM